MLLTMEPVPAPPQESPTGGTPPSGPVMDVVPPPLAEPKAKAPAKPEPAAPVKPAPPKQPGSSVTVAIIATVIIVLGLALLAVYAYLKTQK